MLDYILVLDDNKATLFYYQYILSKQMFCDKIFTSENIIDSLKIIESQKVNSKGLIISDLFLSGENSIDFIHELPIKFPNKKIGILLTSSMLPDNIETILYKRQVQPNYVRYKEKPITEDDIKEFIDFIKSYLYETRYIH